jgi:multicomponent Na+:H+ antiporter subunit D
MIPLFSLAGVPPLSGFLAKLAVIRGVLAGDHYWVAGIALTVSLLTVLSMARLWEGAFWKPASVDAPAAPLKAVMLMPIAVLACLTLGLTVAAGPVFGLSVRAAEQLLNPTRYITAVLGDGTR